MSEQLLPPDQGGFSSLGLNAKLLQAVEKCGYKEPTPIQQQIIPEILSGNDVLGQAQTGTGKTAAFALPLLNNLTLSYKKQPQLLVLTPTRELALQVCESFEQYGATLKKVKTAAIFGGQEYAGQLKKLQQGVHVVVGTPGRIMDHMRRGTLRLDSLKAIVLDEADEMLNMGFLEDIEWIMTKSPVERQVALFSATMPKTIRDIARKYLHQPVEINIGGKSEHKINIEQQVSITANIAVKKKVLQLILESEEIGAGLIFVRTKTQTLELADFITALGYSCGAINGDMAQNQRLRMVEQLKSGKIRILVATDVAARGLDVDRISHVINFDPPFDAESYVHRIGRTGRAGRFGKAFIFLTPQQKRMLPALQKQTNSKIELYQEPSWDDIRKIRISKFKETITEALQEPTGDLAAVIAEYCEENHVAPEMVAAALAKHGKLIVIDKKPAARKNERQKKEVVVEKTAQKKSVKKQKEPKAPRVSEHPEEGMERFRIEVGSKDGVRAANIVGAIANEADIDSEYIGQIAIHDQYSTVDLPYGMPKQILRVLQRARIFNKTMRMSRLQSEEKAERPARAAADRMKKQKKRAPSRKRKAKQAK